MIYSHTFGRRICIRKVGLRFSLHGIQLVVIVGRFMMEEYQLADPGSMGYFRCHLERTMTKSLLSFFILNVRVLCIMYQQIGSLNKLKKSWIRLFSPFDICV